MRHFTIDQLAKQERQEIIDYLKKKAQPGPIDDLFWLPLPTQLLSASQNDHPQCAPFFLAIEVEEERVSFELLVRSQSTLHCPCIAYANPAQREYLLHFIDAMIEQLQLKA